MPRLLLLAALLSACTPTVDLATCGDAPSCATGPTYAFDAVDFVFADETGQVDGFDLDDSVSDANDGLGCRIPDATAPDGRAGIDNRLPQMLSLVGPAFRDAATASFKNAIHTGSMLTLLEFVPATSGAGFSAVVLRRGNDQPLLAIDGSYIPLQTLAVEQQPLMAVAEGSGALTEWTSTAPFDVDFRLDFLGKPLRFPLHGSKVRFRAQDDGRLEVLFGGYILVDDAIGLTGFLGGCDEATGELIRSILPELADIRSVQDECDAISVALNFRAVPVYVFPEVRTKPLEADWLFARAGCQECHAAGNLPRTGIMGRGGPDLHGLKDRAATRAPGVSARDYVTQAITEPGAFVVEGFENTMPSSAGQAFSADELARLTDWLLDQ